MNNEFFNSPEYETTHISKTATYKTFDIMVANFMKISHWVKNGKASTTPFPALFREFSEGIDAATYAAKNAEGIANADRDRLVFLEKSNADLHQKVEDLSNQLFRLQQLISGADVEQPAPAPEPAPQPQQPTQQDVQNLFNSPAATTPPAPTPEAIEIESFDDEPPAKTAPAETAPAETETSPQSTAVKTVSAETGVSTQSTAEASSTPAPSASGPKTPEVQQFEVTASQIDAGEVQDTVLASLESQIDQINAESPLEE